jgi:hypothetical protein
MVGLREKDRADRKLLNILWCVDNDRASRHQAPDSVVQPTLGQSPDKRIVTAKPDISLALQEIPVQTPYQ